MSVVTLIVSRCFLPMVIYLVRKYQETPGPALDHADVSP